MKREYAPSPWNPDSALGIANAARLDCILGDWAGDMTSLSIPQGGAAIIAGQQAQLEAQALLIEEQAAALAHSRKIFERASAAARIGVWECNLASHTLAWTDVVYDIFDLPRGCALDRNEILNCYPRSSRKMLERLRSKAIEDRSGFSLDAEITTTKGRLRWIRITASVECDNGVAVRIFGMKQDITEEKIISDRMRYLAEFDVMTGLCNRSRFQSRLSDLGACDADLNPIGALMLVDLDGFKQVNDTYGHALGDECLKEVALRLGNACSQAEMVARIGGDEFAILLGAHLDRRAMEEHAGAIVEALGRPVDRQGHSLKLGASVGIARVDACTPSELFIHADAALYAAKAAGRNRFCMFDPAMMRTDSGHAPASGTAAPIRPMDTDGRAFRRARSA
ncbi:diguanylate cyclase domain-containing protein [Aurantimonas marianensis]|uniref:Diguanylate cyclase n=1 Tax=Aurantimonas marianensis TaxID=2920428 RepID=A0A9X2HF52_9HYPH|nr:diguanylate cyclase [Aurantimonas marianensis]MCP3056449.1 diguanylate cyclase [Aurantimonas marianensis]